MDYRIFNCAYVIFLMCAYVHGGWEHWHWQWVSTTFWTQKTSQSHKFCVCSWRGSNRRSLDLESNALPTEHSTMSFILFLHINSFTEGEGRLLRKFFKFFKFNSGAVFDPTITQRTDLALDDLHYNLHTGGKMLRTSWHPIKTRNQSINVTVRNRTAWLCSLVNTFTETAWQ